MSPVSQHPCPQSSWCIKGMMSSCSYCFSSLALLAGALLSRRLHWHSSHAGSLQLSMFQQPNTSQPQCEIWRLQELMFLVCARQKELFLSSADGMLQLLWFPVFAQSLLSKSQTKLFCFSVDVSVPWKLGELNILLCLQLIHTSSLSSMLSALFTAQNKPIL